MRNLLQKIERHLSDTGVMPTRFGRDAVGDPRLIADIKNGREPRPETTARILAFIDASRPAPPTAACEALLAALGSIAGRRFAADARSRPWYCAGLAGEWHRLTLRFKGCSTRENVDRLVRQVGEHEFALPGLLVADISVGDLVEDDMGTSVALEALTLEI